jgi:hypothetical protein
MVVGFSVTPDALDDDNVVPDALDCNRMFPWMLLTVLQVSCRMHSMGLKAPPTLLD